VNVGSWRTRLRGPPASRSAHWGSAAFLGVLHVTDVSKRAFGLEVAHVGLDLRPKNIGARLKRVEDPRLIAGQGSFTADRIVPGALHVAFRRSDQAHALISSISTSAAHEAPGVFAIYTAQDLHDLVEPVRASSRMTNYHATALYPLARDKVRYVGEPVVAVLAENRYLAEDVLDRIEIAYEPLGTVIDPEMAVREDARRRERTCLRRECLHAAMSEQKWRRLQYGSADVSGSTARRQSLSRTGPVWRNTIEGGVR